MTRLGLGLAAALVVVDQIVKLWIVDHVMNPPQIIEVTGFFNLVMVWNRGASFGILSGYGELSRWGLSMLAVVISIALYFWLRRAENRWIAVTIAMIIGGAIGNAIDRVRYGAVADFFDLHVAGYHWPAFNIADMAITFGVILLLYDSLIGFSSKPKLPPE